MLAAIVWSLCYFQFTVDDAYISFRYVKTLVTAHTWNWNPSGPHEEAYTSAVYTALAIVPALLRLSPAIFFKLFGLACLAAMLYRLKTVAISPYAFLLGALVLALDPYLWLHVYSGLETPLYMLLIVEMAVCAIQAPTVSAPWVYTVCLLLPLTRPEGIFFAAIGLVLFWSRRGSAPRQLAWFAAAVLLGAIYFVARWRYFHHLLPNPFYVKVNREPARAVLNHLIDNFSEFKGYLLTLVLMALLARSRVGRAFAAGTLLLVLLLFAPYEMPMNYCARYYFQVCFPVFVVFLIAEDIAPISRLATVTAVILLLSVNPAQLVYGLEYFPGITRAHVDLGKRLTPFTRDHTLLAGEMGVIPYYSQWTCFDFAGLATNSIARHPLTTAALDAMRPDLIVLYNARPGPAMLNDGSWAGPEPNASTIVRYLRESGEYDYAGASRAYGFYLVEFLRKDAPQHDQMHAALRAHTEVSETTKFSMRSLLLQKYVAWSQ